MFFLELSGRAFCALFTLLLTDSFTLNEHQVDWTSSSVVLSFAVSTGLIKPSFFLILYMLARSRYLAFFNSYNSGIYNFTLGRSYCLRSASAFGCSCFSLNFDTFSNIFYFSLNVLLQSICFSEQPFL